MLDLQRFSLIALVVSIASCVGAPRRTPARLVSSAFAPAAAAPDRLARWPTVALAFDHAIAPPGDDAVWLVAGAPDTTLRTLALHGALDATHAARRIAAVVAFDPAQPDRLQVTPSRPLAPDTAFVLVTTSALRTTDGADVGDASLGPVITALRVAPARECPPLARLAFPLADGAPVSARHVQIAFDRPVYQSTGEVPAAALLDPTGALVTADARLGCGDANAGYRCVALTLLAALAPAATYDVALGPLADDTGLAPQGVDLRFTTAATDEPAATPDALSVDCADDEAARPPFCVRVAATSLVLRGQTLVAGAVRVRADALGAESAAGTAHTVAITAVAPGASIALAVSTVALDGSTRATVVLAPVASAPALPAVHITEVLATPHSSSAQEFVELANDAASPISLDGLYIATPSGRTALPAVVLAPSARAVIAGPDFDPRGQGDDPAVAAGAVLARLPTRIAGRGLADRGTDVWIEDAAGHELTRAPSSERVGPAPRGASLVRADARMEEDDTAAWSYDSEGASTPGAADRDR